MNAMEIPYDEYDINTNALTIKFEAVSENGTFTYNLLGYSSRIYYRRYLKFLKNIEKLKTIACLSIHPLICSFFSLKWSI